MRWFTFLLVFLLVLGGGVEGKRRLGIADKGGEGYYDLDKFTQILAEQDSPKGIAIGFTPEFTPAGLFVTYNFITHLPDGWVVVVVIKEGRGGNVTQEVVRELVARGGDLGTRKIVVAPVLANHFTRPNYSCLLVEKRFYEAIPTENILIFQEDTLILRKDDGKGDLEENRYKYIRDFTQFPYIGAPWIWRNCRGEWNEDKLCRDAGNGGLSFRRKSVMVNITSQISSNSRPSCPSEDLVLVSHMDSSPFSSQLPPRSVGRQFSVETVPFREPWGVHKPWKYFPKWITGYPDLMLLHKLHQKEPDYSAFMWWLDQLGLPRNFFDKFMKTQSATPEQIELIKQKKKVYIPPTPLKEPQRYSEIKPDGVYMNNYGNPSFRDAWWNKNRYKAQKTTFYNSFFHRKL